MTGAAHHSAGPTPTSATRVREWAHAPSSGHEAPKEVCNLHPRVANSATTEFVQQLRASSGPGAHQDDAAYVNHVLQGHGGNRAVARALPTITPHSPHSRSLPPADVARVEPPRHADQPNIPAAPTVPQNVGDVLHSPGRPLDAFTRGLMERGFGQDFGNVRVHIDERAAESARAVNARAYTVGNDVVFGAHQYAPATPRGRELLAHELAHTVQQRSAAGAPPSMDPHGIFESSAQTAGRTVANGGIYTDRLPTCGVGLSRDLLTGESDIYAAPIDVRPVDQMSKSAVDDEINRLERWLGKQNQSTPDVVKRETRLADLRQRQTELNAPVKARRSTPVVAVKPRCLTEPLDITQMTRSEMAAELDSIVRFLRLGPSKSDIAKVARFKQALEQALEGQREQENEQVRRRDIAFALQPMTTANTYEDFRKVLTVIASISPDPDNPAQAALHLPNGMTVPVSSDEATALKTQAARMINKYAAQSESLAEETYQAFQERRLKGQEHPIVHGLVKWAADVDDLDELEMFGKKEQARSMQAQIKGLADGGKLIPAFNVSVGLEAWSEGYARQVGQWEAALMDSAGRWALGLTILKEGLTLLATAGAGSLIGSARSARGISALRATAEVASVTTFAGTAGAVGGYAASEKLTGGEVTRGGAWKAGRVGAGTGLAIGAAPGAVGAAKEVFGVGKAATTLGNVGRSVAAEVVGSTPVNVASAGIQGESMKDAAISTVASSTLSGAGAPVVAKIAKGSKVVSAVGDAAVGGWSGAAGALATGKDTRDTVIAGAFGTAGGALGPHLMESNKNYLEGRSRGSSREEGRTPPIPDERFDFSDTVEGRGARSEGSAPPAVAGVGGKFDLSDVGGSPTADAGGRPVAGATGGPRTGAQSKTGYSRTAPTGEEEIASAAGRTRRRVGAVDRGKGARPRYANDPVRPKMTTPAAKPSSRGAPDVGRAVEEATEGTATAARSPAGQEQLGGAARRPEIDDPGVAQPQRLRPEPSLGGGAEAARAAGLPSEVVDSGYVYTREDLPDVVPETGFRGARAPKQSPLLAAERTRGVAGKRPTTAPDPGDAQNATLDADLRLIEDHLATLNRNAPPGTGWTLEDLRINRTQTAEGPAGPIRASAHTRPDLQFTIRDPAGRPQRFLIEYDRSPPARALGHIRGILERDPTAIVISKVVGFE